MSEALWTAVDAYIGGHLVPRDAALEAAVQASDAAGLPQIAVSAAQGKFLAMLAEIRGARRILEIGTLGGYSTIWLARALPAGGRLVTLEVDPAHAAVARSNLARAGVADRVDVRVAPALETLPKLQAEGGEPFDFVFIDADKPNNPVYFDWAVRLGRPGTVIVVDNVVRKGAIVDAANVEPNVVGTRALYEHMAKDSRVRSTVLQTVGSKGHDGVAIAIVGTP